MSDGREEREEQEQRRKWREKENEGDPEDRPYREREWEDRVASLRRAAFGGCMKTQILRLRGFAASLRMTPL